MIIKICFKYKNIIAVTVLLYILYHLSFVSYKEKHPSDLALVLIGKTNMDIPKRQDILCTGFVSEQDKFDGLAGAVLTIAPSKYYIFRRSQGSSWAVGINKALSATSGSP